MKPTEIMASAVPGGVKLLKARNNEAVVLSYTYDDSYEGTQEEPPNVIEAPGLSWYVSYLDLERYQQAPGGLRATVRYQIDHPDAVTAAREFGELQVQLRSSAKDQPEVSQEDVPELPAPEEPQEAPQRRGPQKRERRGKAQHPEYKHSMALVREDRYEHIFNKIRTNKELQERIAEECRRHDVEPGGGKPAYGYSELVEMLLVRWMKDHGIPMP